MTNQNPMYGAFGTHIQGLITPARRLSGAGQNPPAPAPGHRTGTPPTDTAAAEPGSSTERSTLGHLRER